ncbi:putative ABC transporter permease [Ligilactobacillus sp.]|uniref:putative ABC transporter permease n=1 Tax=Ligilactobacillus sp. TaxID=2767921 RepID=UPI002FE41B0D
MYTINDLVLLFFIYSFVGWLWETVYCSSREGHFVYRGFLFGPYCPVYGFAVSSVLLFTQELTGNLLLLFLVGTVVSTVFEYLAGAFLENVFHLKLWDYSRYPGNVKGRIAPFISLFWGVGTVVLTAFVQPHVMRLVDFLEDRTGTLADLFVIVVMGGDAAVTIFNMQKFRAHALVLEQRIQAERLRLKNEAERIIEERPYFKLASLESRSSAIQNYIEKWHETILHRLDASFNFNERRMLKSFPKMKLLEAPHLDEIREKLLKK